jgi:two-component system, NarL family, sensor histidine kinase YdfH
MPTNSSSKSQKVLGDTYFFVLFRILVVASVYVISLIISPDIRQLNTLIPFTLLIITHLFLYWQMLKFMKQPTKMLWFVLIQGIVVILILTYTRNVFMTLVMYMVLVGDAIGLFKLTVLGIFSSIYYLVMMFISMVQLSGWDSASSMFIGWIPLILIVIISVAFYMRQNDAREQAQSLADELEIANEQLEEYAANIEDLTIANERQRLARELHDTLTQGVAGLILQLDAADANLNKNNVTKAQSIIGNAMKEARSIMVDARNAIDDLRQPPQENLNSALQNEISSFTKLTGIPVQFSENKLSPVPEIDIDTVVCFVSEALTNASRHANAQKVEIECSIKDEILRVCVKDDGQGFDPSSTPPGHYGLLGIKERVSELNGVFNIQSEVGKGSNLSIELPL